MKLSTNNKIISLLFSILAVLLYANQANAEMMEGQNASGIQHRPANKLEYRGESPGQQFAWIEGYWNWEKDKWVWHKGRYTKVIQDRPPINNHDFMSTPPSHRHTWIPGRWIMEEGDWSWSKGHYKMRPFVNAFWTPGHWRRSASGWVWVKGHW